MTLFASPEVWLGLLTLTVLEIVLGIDNIIFISILAGKLPAAQQARARRVGLAGAMVTRIALLAALAWIIRLTGESGVAGTRVRAAFAAVVGQIVLLDIVFSLDSVITAVGMARHLAVMIAAVVLAVGVMMFAATPISDFVHRHPTVKMLALSFLLLIGVSLIADGLGQHIAKGYIYFAMGFSVFVEMLNIRMRARTRPVELREAYTAETPAPRS